MCRVLMLWCIAALSIWFPSSVFAQASKYHVFHASESGTANGTPLSASSFSTIGVQIEGTWTGTLTFQSKTGNAAGYVDTQCRNRTSGAVSSTATSNGYYDCPGSTAQFIVAAAVSTGTVFVSGIGSVGSAGIVSSSSSGVSVAEDVAHVSGENIVPLGCRRIDTAATSAGTSGDWATVDCDANGAVRVRIDSTAVGSTSNDDDGTITAGTTSMSEVITRPYTFNGTDWKRPVADPCSTLAKTFLPINISTATTTEITPSLAGASTNYYVCSLIILPTAGAQTLAVVDDDSDGCGSVTSGLAGGTSAASGATIAAYGGWVAGNGSSSIMKTNGTNRVICIVTGSAVQTSGVMTVVAAP